MLSRKRKGAAMVRAQCGLDVQGNPEQLMKYDTYDKRR